MWALYTQRHSLDWGCPDAQFPKCLSCINDLEQWNSLRTRKWLVNPPFYHMYVQWRAAQSQPAASLRAFQLTGLEEGFSTLVPDFVSLPCSLQQQLSFTLGADCFSPRIIHRFSSNSWVPGHKTLRFTACKKAFCVMLRVSCTTNSIDSRFSKIQHSWQKMTMIYLGLNLNISEMYNFCLPFPLWNSS